MSIHRGTVVNNLDPLGLGRLQVTVPDVGPGPLAWAMPVLPLWSTEAMAPPQLAAPYGCPSNGQRPACPYTPADGIARWGSLIRDTPDPDAYPHCLPQE